MTAPSNAELREAIEAIIYCTTGCGSNADPADGFGYCTCGTKEEQDRLVALFQAHQQELLSELLGELPEYLPECLKYPLGSGTVCNKCRACKLRHYDTNGEAGTVFDFTIELVVEILNRKIGELNG